MLLVSPDSFADDSDHDSDHDCVKVRADGSLLLSDQPGRGAAGLQVMMTMMMMLMTLTIIMMICRYGVLEDIFLPPTAVSIPRTQVGSTLNSIV